MSREDPVALCTAGRLSPEVALARLVLDGVPPERLEMLLPPGSTIAVVARARRSALVQLAAMLRSSGAEHAHDTTPSATAALFDRAVAVAPEASVAAWSMNDPALLAAGTAELLAWLAASGTLHGRRDVLDLGCGIGRVAAALAPHVASVVGLDVSPGMIAQARQRHRTLPNVRFALTDGVPPLALEAQSLDLVLAVDSFPYVMQAGAGAAMLADAARLLRPGGSIAVLNLSYRDDPEADATDARDWAGRFGLALHVCGERPFRLWDGAAYVWWLSP